MNPKPQSYAVWASMANSSETYRSIRHGPKWNQPPMSPKGGIFWRNARKIEQPTLETNTKPTNRGIRNQELPPNSSTNNMPNVPRARMIANKIVTATIGPPSGNLSDYPGSKYHQPKANSKSTKSSKPVPITETVPIMRELWPCRQLPYRKYHTRRHFYLWIEPRNMHRRRAHRGMEDCAFY